MKYCVNCKTKQKSNAKYCESCGQKLIIKKNVRRNLFPDLTRIIKPQFWIIAVVLLLFIFVIVGNTIKLPYYGLASYTEKSPVNTVEEYTVTEPYYIDKCHKANISYTTEWGEIERECLEEKCDGRYTTCVSSNEQGGCMHYETLCERSECLKYQLNCKLEIRNEDNADGVFRFKGYVINNNNAKNFVQNVTVNVSERGLGTGSWSFNHSPGNTFSCWSTDMLVSNKTVCDQLTRYRTVTKQRNKTLIQEVEKHTSIELKRTLFQALGWVKIR